MAKPQLQQLKEFFAQGGSSEYLSTPAERELLKRISVLKSFDKEIFKHLKQNLTEKGAIEFAQFVKHLHIEPVPRTINTYAIKEDARNLYLDQLMSDRNSDGEAWKNAKEVFQKLIHYYKENGAEFDLDRLVLLTLTDPDKVKDELESLYKEADERFDLARCDDLLRAFEIRFRLLPDELQRFCKSRRQYYLARNLYISDYYQTSTYLERGNMTKSFAELLTPQHADNKPWVFHVYATGGLGKTIFVSSLISRYCLPEPNRIPVARLDFDLLDLTYAGRYPLLLLLPVADQLNQQIEEKPFTEVFSDMRQFKPLLETPMGGAPNINRPELESSFKTLEAPWRETALKEFCRTLEEIRFDKPIVIAIDTFEEMLLLNKDGLIKIIEQVQEMHKALPGLRLILTGRYDLREELNDHLNNFFANETLHCELKPFAREEARTYLIQKRGLKEAPLIEATVEKCAENSEGEINPFILSLMSDLVSAKEIKTVEEIKKSRAEVAYMIQRIIERIQDFDVRWMLRYAVIPRVLTLEVLENILWPHLEQERQKKRGEDKRRKLDDLNQADYWRYGDASTAREAWEKLKPFVSSYGWVRYDGNDKTRLRFHADVIVPMRFLLAQERIFELLHKDASSYFAKKAEDKPDEFADWMSEAVYHRFQSEGQKASIFWREQMYSKRIANDLEARRRLAAEITKRRDYVDEKGTPLKWPKFDEDPELNEDIVSEKDLCLAHYEVAVDSIMLATKNKPESDQYADEWEQAREHLFKLDFLLKSGAQPDFKIDFDTGTYAKLAAQLNKPVINYDLVIVLMEEALSSTGGLFLPLALQLQLAEMYARINSEKAENYFRKALDTRGIRGIPFLSPPGIHLKLARWYQNNKRFTRALTEYGAALARPDLGESSALRRKIKYGQAEVNRESGLYVSAARIAQQLYESTPRDATDSFDHALLLGHILSRELYRPLLVLNRLSELEQLAGDQTKRTAALTELHGCVLSQLMEFKEAPNILDSAKEQWGHVPDSVSADRARMYRFEFQLDQIGNVQDPAFLLEAWETENQKQPSTNLELTCQLVLLRVRSLYLQSTDNKALEKWRSLRNRNDVATSARALVRVLSTGLALGFGDPETFQDLLAVLSKIDPPSARLPLLGAFRFAERNTNAGTMHRDRGKLIELVEWPPEKRPAVASVLMFVDVLRFCNATDRVEVLLEREIATALERQDLFAYVHLLSALNRSGLYALRDADIYTSSFLKEYSSYPNLCFAALLEQAERELENEELDKCESALRDAVNNYGNSETLNRWKAFAEELRGRLALRSGDAKKATAHLAKASSIHERLGNKRSAAQIRMIPIGRRNPRLLEPPTRQETTHSIRLETLTDGITVSNSSGRQKIESREFPASDLTTQLTASLRDRTEMYNLMARITDDFTGFTHELGRLMLAPEEIEYFRNLPQRERLFDVRLDLPQAAAKIPWEWAAAEKDPVLSFFRYFYRSSSANAGESEAIKWIHFAASVQSNVPLKIDGFFGPPIRDLLKKMRVDQKLTVPEIYERVYDRLMERGKSGHVRVLIIKPSFETQLSTQRGSFASSFSPQYLYDELGFNSAAIDVSRPENLKDLASLSASFKPQLIHIESSFRQNPTTADVYLDFNVQSSSDRTSNDNSHLFSEYQQLSTTLLNDVLASVPDTMLRPVVILEGQRTPSLSSTIHQVLLRNTFASELFRLGNTSGVIATGLFRYPGDRLRLLRPLISQLANMGSLGMAVNEINSRNIVTKADADLISCPVLLTDNPMFVLIPTQ